VTSSKALRAAEIVYCLVSPVIAVLLFNISLLNHSKSTPYDHNACKISV